MMKSYQQWQSKKVTDTYYRDVILPQVVEWSIHDPFGRGMSSQETVEMERIGKMFGYNKGWWNIFKRDSRHAGDDATSLLQKIVAMPDGRQKSEELAKWVNSSWKVSQNAPFKQAYDRINTVKMQVNKRDPNGLRADQVQWLVDVLKNSFRGGNVPFKTLQDLWYVVTGITDGKNICQDCKDAALHNDVHTPWHLLRYLFGVGGGFFSEPSNKTDLTRESSQLLKKFYPDKYQELLGGPAAPAAQQTTQGNNHAADVANAVNAENPDDASGGSASTGNTGSTSPSNDPNQHFRDMEAGNDTALNNYLSGKKTPAEKKSALVKLKTMIDAHLSKLGAP
jgi:hypothetical protein